MKGGDFIEKHYLYRLIVDRELTVEERSQLANKNYFIAGSFLTGYYIESVVEPIIIKSDILCTLTNTNLIVFPVSIAQY